MGNIVSNSSHGFRVLTTAFKTLASVYSVSFKPLEYLVFLVRWFPQVHISCHVQGFSTLL